MGTKNNPKNRGDAGKKVFYRDQEVEPIMFYDTDKKINYLSAKVSKSNDIVLDSDSNPIKWSDVTSA